MYINVNLESLYCKVAETPLFWAALDLEVWGPGADSGSDQIGSAPGKKRRSMRLWLHALKFFILSSYKVNYWYKSFLDRIYRYKLLFKSCFVTTTRLSFFAWQKDAAGALWLRLSAPANQKNGSGSSTLLYCGMLDIINFLPSVNYTGEEKTSWPTPIPVKP